MAVKNGASYVAASIESVLSQTIPSTRFLVIDDHSTDETRGILERYASEIEVFENEGFGQAAAINLGLKKINTEFVTFIDHDDLWESKKTELSLGLIRNTPNLDVISCGLVNFEGNGSSISKREFASTRVFGACLFRSSVFQSVGMLDEDLKNHAIVEWWTRESAHKLKVAAITEPLYLRRVHQSNSGLTRKEEARSDLFSILRGRTSLSQDLEIQS